MFDCLSETELAALAANETISRDRAAVEAHLMACDGCSVGLAAARERLRNVAERETQKQHESKREAERAHELALDGYEVLSRIEGGGQGVVYKAVQKSTNRTVAVKVLSHEASASAQQKQRFEREVSLAASLRHPNIVTVYDSGLMSGRYYFAMEYIHGKPLTLAAQGLSRDERLELFAKVCAAVGHAHQRNVLHRDLKPANVLVDARHEPHVLDFGLAKSAAVDMVASAHEHQPLTVTSQFMGTLAYASPEQTFGDPALVDQRSDVYALGVMLYEVLTGTLPYKLTPDLVGTFKVIRNEAPRKPSETPGGTGIDRDLDTIMLRALAKDPNRRYQSADDLAADIRRYRAGEPITARRDSVVYLTTVKTRAALRRHPVLTAIGVALLAAELGHIGGQELHTAWPAPGRWFEYAAGLGQSPSAAEAFEPIRLIAIDNTTHATIDRLAAEAGLEDVSSDNWVSMRRAHGHLMKRLAEAGAKAVVWDITFVNESPFDADFAAGVEALRARDAGTVVGVYPWDITNPEEPPIAPLIRHARVLWGGTTIGIDDRSAWKVDLVVQHEDGTPLPSLALAALCAWMHPGLDVMTQLHDERDEVELQFRALDSSVMQAVRDKVTITLSALRAATGSDDDREFGLDAGSLVGIAVIQLPPENVFTSITRPYHEVFAIPMEELAAWCDGRLVLVSDNRDQPGVYYDRHRAADGREAWGGEAHAVAISGLLQNAAPAVYVRGFGYFVVMTLAALVGMLAAHHRVGSNLRRVLLLVALVGVSILLCMVAYQLGGYVMLPLTAVVAMVLAFAMWFWLDCMRTFRVQ